MNLANSCHIEHRTYLYELLQRQKLSHQMESKPVNFNIQEFLDLSTFELTCIAPRPK